MDVALVKKYRELADKNHLPMKVICDNEHWFLHNVDNGFKIIWDDESETLTAMHTNNDYYSQCALPIKLTVTQYEHIQFIEVFMDKVAAVVELGNQKDSGKLTESEFEHDLQLLSNHASISTLQNDRGTQKA